MTGRTLTEQALQKKPTNRLPCFPLIDLAFASSFIGKPLRELEIHPKYHADALSLCAQKLPVDGIYVNICLSETQTKGNASGSDTILLDEALELKLPENDVMSIAHSRISDLDDDRIFNAELFHPGMRETMRQLSDSIKQSHAICVGLSGTFTQGAFLLGLERFMMELIDNPSGVKKMLDRRHEKVLTQASELLDDGARFIWIGEGPASGSLISPAFYDTFVLPYEKSLTDFIRAKGGLSILHICGNTTALLLGIAKSGADGFDLDYPVDLKRAIDVLLPNIAVKGNINPTLFLSGCEAELITQTKAAVQDVKGKPGAILSTGCLVPRDSLPEAFKIFAEICATGNVN